MQTNPDDALEAAVRRFAPGLPLAVAFSGGADSTALLLACAERWPGRVRAIHVHHGLQSAADGFAAHCQTLCDAQGIPVRLVRTDGRAPPGESPENAARIARYASLSRVAHGAWPDDPVRDVALAQHADDQAETLLLALSRGAGLPGLASMRRCWTTGGVTFHRPLLQVPGATLRRWLTARGVAWIEDPTNSDQELTRNRIRARVVPGLAEAFPQYRTTFARSASHAAEAQALLEEVAVADLLACGCPPSLGRLRAMGAARRANLLRHWLASVHATVPSTAQMRELQRQIDACATRGHRIAIKVGTGFVRRAGAGGEMLDWYNSALPASPPSPPRIPKNDPEPAPAPRPRGAS
ncbi:MAG: tRNA lysidine(34) synthetase TilS [Xylophilus ampelinus]